jgi:hypothetical protein
MDAFGKQSDGGAFSVSTLFHFLEDLNSTLPMPASFEGSGTEMPFVILAEHAYPPKTHLVEPSQERICRVKNMFLIAGCREQGDALSVLLVS